MNDYSLDTKNIDMAEELQKELQDLFSKGINETTFSEIEKIFYSIKSKYAKNTALLTLNEVMGKINESVRSYQLSNTFKALSDPDYNLIRDGLITIGAEANAGKTSFLTALCIDILKHNDDTAFLMYSLDDSTTMTAKRILSQIAQTNLFNKINPNDLDKINPNMINRIVLSEDLNINRLEEDAIITLKRTKKDRIIIGIDYLQIIPINFYNNTARRENFNDAIKQIKEVQKKLHNQGCIIFLISQLNRDTDSTTFRYRETSEIENQSDVCIDILFNTKIEVKGKSKKILPDWNNPERIIRVSKNKLGKKGRKWKTKINKDFTFTKLQEIEETETEEKSKETEIDPFEYWEKVDWKKK